MTEIKNLTETDTVYPNNLFLIYDGIRTRSVEASAVKDFCAQNGIGTDEAFIAGRIANNILYMTRATGEEVAIGDLDAFRLEDHTIQELGNVDPLEADKFLKVSSDGQRIEYSVADPQGDEIGVEDSGSALGKAQNLNFASKLEVTLDGNTATIDCTVQPSGYKNLGVLSGGDDPKTLDTGICYVSGQFVGAPVFPTADYQGYLIKQKQLKEGEAESVDAEYQLIIYYSIYGTYLKPKYAGVWYDDWYTMMTHNTDQDISADKRFKANSHLGFNRQINDLSDAYKLIADSEEFYLRAYSNAHAAEVDSIKVDKNGAVSFPSTINIVLTDAVQEITAPKNFINDAAISFIHEPGGYAQRTEGENLIFFANDNYPSGVWRHAIGINRFGHVWFPNTGNIMLTDKDQTVVSNKTFNNAVIRNLFSHDLWAYHHNYRSDGFKVDSTYDGRPGFNHNALNFWAWVDHLNRYEAAFVVTSKGTAWINPYRSFATVTPDNFNKALEFRDPRYDEGQDLRASSYIEKIQIKIVEPFDTPLNLAFECGRARTSLYESEELNLHETGIIDVPIAELLTEEIQPSLRLLSNTRAKPTKGKAYAFLIVH